MTALARVLVRGDGVAAACCPHLLRRSNLAVRIEGSGRSRVPAIMLSDPAVALLREVFDRPGLLANAPRIDRRGGAWGGQPVCMPHSAQAASEDGLLAALAIADEADFEGAPDFVIHTGAPAEGGQRRFGARKAVAAEIRMKAADDLSACWVEALDDGWLFVAPNPGGSSWLLAVGGPPERLLAQSTLIADRIELTPVRSGAFDVCPRIAAAPTDQGRMACGTAAVAFDPICGDGVAQAVRGAILGVAVIVAISEGGDARTLLAHYDLMMIATMRRHLKLCADFYEAMDA